MSSTCTGTSWPETRWDIRPGYVSRDGSGPFLRLKNPGAIALGIRVGVALSVCVVVLAFVGLTPQFSWVPELPLLAVSVLIPLVGYTATGYRAQRQSGRIGRGVLAAAVAGVVSGLAGGICFVLFGKPLLNIPVGIGLGCVAGAVWGAAGALLSVQLGHPRNGR